MTTRRDDDGAILLRHLLGESPAAERAELERRLAVEPALARELAALERSWRGLELPPAAPAPPGFATRVAARAGRSRAEEAGSLRLRWAAVAALALGIGLGTTISAGLAVSIGAGAEGAESAGSEIDATLAESYLDAVERAEADATNVPYVPYVEGGALAPEAEGTPR